MKSLASFRLSPIGYAVLAAVLLTVGILGYQNLTGASDSEAIVTNVASTPS